MPDLKNDTFKRRLHWLVSNIRISPTQTQAIGLNAIPGATTIKSYLPPHVQKGIKYHRYCLFVFRQEKPIVLKEEAQNPLSAEVPESGPTKPDTPAKEVSSESNRPLGVNSETSTRSEPKELKVGYQKRDGFDLRSFQAKFQLKPIGAFIWRGEWDSGTKDVMERLGLDTWKIRFERAKD